MVISRIPDVEIQENEIFMLFFSCVAVGMYMVFSKWFFFNVNFFWWRKKCQKTFSSLVDQCHPFNRHFQSNFEAIKSTFETNWHLCWIFWTLNEKNNHFCLRKKFRSGKIWKLVQNGGWSKNWLLTKKLKIQFWCQKCILAAVSGPKVSFFHKMRF